MNIFHRNVLVSASLALCLSAVASASEPVRVEVPAVEADATAPQSELPQVPDAQLERLREIAERDPAGFRDLLRRDLAARLLWRVRGDGHSADLPVELAGDMTPAQR